MRTITVKGTGNVSARPDYIILSLNIETLSKTYDRAMSEAAERIERLQGAAVCVGYRKEDLKTTSFDVQTRYENVKDRQGNYKRVVCGIMACYLPPKNSPLTSTASNLHRLFLRLQNAVRSRNSALRLR